MVAGTSLHEIKNVDSLGDGRKNVTAAGTAEALVDTSTPCQWVVCTAYTNNTSYVVVGGSTVVAALATRRGAPLAASDPCTILINDVQKVYIDALVSGEGVTFFYGE